MYYILYYTYRYNEQKHRQMSLTMTKDKSSEIHIGERRNYR